MGYQLQVCNATTTAHTVTSISASIASFTPSSGPVNVWHICGYGPYDPATRHTTPGCGGGIGKVVFLAATLPSDSAGASAPVSANAQLPVSGAGLPASIGPNRSLRLLFAVNGLTSQGAYSLTFSISVDGAAPMTLAPSDGAFLIAPNATPRTGTACQTPPMQALIPSFSQGVYYVCPPAA